MFPETEAALRKALSDALGEIHAKDLASRKGSTEPSRIDKLIAKVVQSDPAFAIRIRQYFDAISSPDFLVDAVAKLWNSARLHQRTIAAELEFLLGGKTIEFENTKGLTEEQETEEMRQLMLDPRVFIDTVFANDSHGSHIHAFHQYIGDVLWGAGQGLEFRQHLATLTGEGVTEAPQGGKQLLWEDVWNALFDETDGSLHQPEKLGRVLQDLADFPLWER